MNTTMRDNCQKLFRLGNMHTRLVIDYLDLRKRNIKKVLDIHAAAVSIVERQCEEISRMMPDINVLEKDLLSACALVFNESGQILTVSRRGKPNDIGLPGGKIDPGETSFDTVIRELFEETGIMAVETMPVYERPEETADDRFSRTFYIHSWLGEPKSCEPGLTVRWANPEELLTSDCSFRRYNESLFAALSF